MVIQILPNKYSRKTEGRGAEGRRGISNLKKTEISNQIEERIEIEHIKNYYLKSHQHFILENQG